MRFSHWLYFLKGTLVVATVESTWSSKQYNKTDTILIRYIEAACFLGKVWRNQQPSNPIITIIIPKSLNRDIFCYTLNFSAQLKPLEYNANVVSLARNSTTTIIMNLYPIPSVHNKSVKEMKFPITCSPLASLPLPLPLGHQLKV